MTSNENNDIRQLLSLSFEIEGLLMLAQRRDDMTPREVIDLLTDKCATLLDGVARLRPEAPEAPTEPMAEPVVEPVAAPAAACETLMEEKVADNSEIAAAVEFEETEDAEPNIPVPDPAPEVEAEEPIKEEPAPAPAPEPAPAPAPEPIQEPAPAPAPAPAPEPSKTVRNITLTLNDKFRFRRTLFGGSDARMSETLAILASLSDRADIEDFIVNDLCWNPDDQEVADFLEVIEAAR